MVNYNAVTLYEVNNLKMLKANIIKTQTKMDDNIMLFKSMYTYNPKRFFPIKGASNKVINNAIKSSYLVAFFSKVICTPPTHISYKLYFKNADHIS